jgi:replicative DNA helicase
MAVAKTDQAFERVPPQAVEAEKSVLGSMLLEKDAIAAVIGILEPRDFYKEAHRNIFSAIVRLYDRNVAADFITLTDELKKGDHLEAVGGQSYLSTLFDYVGTAAHVEHHAKIVRDKAILRELIGVSAEIARKCYESGEGSSTLLDEAESRVFAISGQKLRPGFVAMKELLKGSFETIQRFYDQGRHIRGIASGFADLDEKTSGFQPSELTILAGRPSMGKTALALNIAQHVGVKLGVPVGFFSLEMSSEEVVIRMLCAEALVDNHKLRTGYLRDSDWPKLTTAAGSLSAAPIYIDDSPGLSVLEMRAKARRLKAERGVGLLLVDYIQMLRGLPNPESRQIEMSLISRSLKELAKELKIPVIAVSQLSRAVEQRGGDKRPILSDLRESGALEQDADAVIFVYRAEYYDDDDTPSNIKDDHRGKAELIIAKQRNGPTGTVRVVFLHGSMRFMDLARAT